MLHIICTYYMYHFKPYFCHSKCSLLDPEQRHSILKDSIFETKRNRTFWTQLHQIRPDGVINPLLIKHIDSILLVGRSINLLKHLCPSHPILNVPSPLPIYLGVCWGANEEVISYLFSEMIHLCTCGTIRVY